jgi:hypothetical protein
MNLSHPPVVCEQDKLARHLAHDLRMASIHEAAHVVVATRLGLNAQAHVIPSGTANPIEEKLFIGQTRHAKGNSHQTKMICLAGTVAEECDGDPDVDGIGLMDWIESGVVALSDTDAAGAGAYTAEDLDHCIGLVREAWTEIEAEAERLAEQGMRLYREMQETAGP